MPVVYEELRAIARRQLSAGEDGGSLPPTDLVHGACRKLVLIAAPDQPEALTDAIGRQGTARAVQRDRAKARMLLRRAPAG